MQPAPDPDTVVVAAEIAPAAVGEHLFVVVATDTGDCAVTSGVVTAEGLEVPTLDAPVVRWLSPAGPVRTSAQPVEPCDGLPPVDSLVVPAAGWAIGLRHPATTPVHRGPFDLVPIGADARWWHLLPGPDAEGPGVVTFDHATAPPTRIVVNVEPRLVGNPAPPVTVARGGATVVDAGDEVTYVGLVATDRVEVHAVGASLVILGRRPGTADGVMRVGVEDPEPLRIEVRGPLASTRGEVSVPTGGRRRFLVEREVRAVWIGAPETLAVELRGRRLILVGAAPGRTELVLQDDLGTLVIVPVAVGG